MIETQFLSSQKIFPYTKDKILLKENLMKFDSQILVGDAKAILGLFFIITYFLSAIKMQRGFSTPFILPLLWKLGKMTKFLWILDLGKCEVAPKSP